MHRRLLDDGATWRAEFPPSEGFGRSVEEFGRGLAAQALEPSADQQHSQHMRERAHMHLAGAPQVVSSGLAAEGAKPSARRAVVALVAALTIAALFAVV